MKRLIVSLSGMFLFLITQQQVCAQEASNPLLYSYQAVQFSDQNISHDPVTLVLPGVAYASGFSSYLNNPASAALFESSYGSFGLSFRNVDETTAFLGNRNTFNDNQTGVSNLGFVYKFPTVRGNLVIGAGYSQHSYYNRAMSISGRNQSSTMTDFFKIPGSIYEDLAFETYAIDWADEDETFFDSIFRIGFPAGDFPGITQEAEILERGQGGDISGFIATEFLENLMVGASLGIQTGYYNYERIFLEVDEFNDYDGDFIETDEGGTDIDTILLTDEMRSEYLSLAARVGAIYRINDRLNLGLSYTAPSKLSVDEEFDIGIASTFDNGVIFEDELLSEFSYSVTSPARINLGAAVTGIAGLSASFAAERVDYSNTRIHFDSELFEDERNENQFISDTYTSVWNLRGGLAYDITGELTLRAGYGIKPSRFRDINMDEQQISGGVGFAVGRNTRIDIGAQYSFFDETSVLYEYEDHNFMLRSEFADRDVNRLQVLATLRMNLN
ncbi:MAG: outer membrane protein transport protein [Balneolaceae bacterium]